MKIRQINHIVCVVVIYTMVAIAVTYFFCFYISPMWNEFGGDQSMFSIIGEGWKLGRVPYIDLWDSKGPIIFFVNMLGHSIAPGEIGICILQVLNIASVLILSHYFLSRCASVCNVVIFQIIFLLVYVLICSGGNHVGDTTLLLSALVVFLSYKWVLNVSIGIYNHSWKRAFIYGVFVSSCFLSRLTNGAIAISFSVVVVAVLAYNRMWGNLLASVTAFVVGFIVVFLPFAVYFGCHGAFHEMWYAMFSYNLEYAGHSHNLNPHSLKHLLYFISNFCCILFPVLLFVISVILRRRRKINLILALSVLPALCWAINSYAYANYAISYLPILFVSLVETQKLMKWKRVPKYAMSISLLFVVLYIRNYRIYYEGGPDANTRQSLMITKDVPSNETFVAYNVCPTYYIYADRRPCYRFFATQDWAIENGPSLRQKVVDCYRSGRAEWILVYQYGQSNIKGVLDGDYELYRYDEKYDLSLFKRK